MDHKEKSTDVRNLYRPTSSNFVGPLPKPSTCSPCFRAETDIEKFYQITSSQSSLADLKIVLIFSLKKYSCCKPVLKSPVDESDKDAVNI